MVDYIILKNSYDGAKAFINSVCYEQRSIADND
jgi:hypothetical protein